MRWPFRKREDEMDVDAAPAVDDDLPEPSLSGGAMTAPSGPTGPIIRGPLPSMPRTDWAHLQPTIAATAPIVTVDAGSFAREAAGSSSLVFRSAVTQRSDSAAAGLLTDIAVVEDVTTTEILPSDGPSAKHRAAGTDLPAAPDPIRRPLVVDSLVSSGIPVGRLPEEPLAFASVAGTSSSSDESLSAGSTPIGMEWNVNTGFSSADSPAEDDSGEDPTPPAGMRVIRRRNSTGIDRPGLGSPLDPGDFEEVGSDDIAADATLVNRKATPAGDADLPPGPASLRYLPAPGPRPSSPIAEHPPAGVAAVVAAVTGVDVSDARIIRTADSARRAEEMGAHAFTERGEVHLPVGLGDLHDPTVEAVLAHELTHVAQARRGDGSIPDEDSEAGIELEEEALRVQEAMQSHNNAPLYLRSHPVGETRGAAGEGVQRLAYDWQRRERPIQGDLTQQQHQQNYFNYLARREQMPWLPEKDAEEFTVDLEGEERGRRFEEEFEDELVQERTDRATELRAAWERELTVAQIRSGVYDPEAQPPVAPPQLNRPDMIAVREQLDGDMPFQTISDVERLYPGLDLPDANEPERGREQSQLSSTSRAHLRSNSTGSGRGPGQGSTSPEDDPRAWQLDDAAQAARAEQMAEYIAQVDTAYLNAMRSGSDFDIEHPGEGIVRPGTDPAADEESLPEDAKAALHRRRRQRERALEEQALRDKAAGERRSGNSGPVQLTADDRLAVRVGLDEEMPLFHETPRYLGEGGYRQLNAENELEPQTEVEDESTQKPGKGPNQMSGTGPQGPGTANASSARGSGSTSIGGSVSPQTGTGTTSPPVQPNTAASASGGAASAGTASGSSAGSVGAGASEAGTVSAGTPSAQGAEADDGTGDRTAQLPLDAESLTRLSRALMPRMREYLRTELIHERERAGYAADLR